MNFFFMLPESIKNHCKKDKLSKKRNHKRGGGNNFSKQQEEHGEREQDVDGQTHLHF